MGVSPPGVNIASYQMRLLVYRGPAQSVCVADCYFIVNFKSMINKRSWYIVVLFASKAVFWAILKLEVWVRRWLFLLIEVESKAMRFWGKNRSGTGALSKHGFHPCPSIIRNSQRRTRECFLLLESTFLRVSRLATLSMHGLNTMFVFAALVMFCTFALPFWALLTAPFFWEVCPVHSVSMPLCTFFHGTWLFSILLLLS